MEKKNKNLLILIISVLLIADMPFLLYLSNFNSIAFDENFYKKEFQKYNVYDNLKNYNVEEINNEVLDYLKSEKNSLNFLGHKKSQSDFSVKEKKNKLIEGKNNFFNQREKEHLLDVKNLIQKTLKFYYFAIILFFILLISLIYLLNKNILIVKYLGIIFLISGILAFLDAFIFFLMINSNFSSTFDIFHNVFFEQGTFAFDPSFENIVNLYPEQLFFDIARRIIANTLIFSFLVSLAGILFLAAIKYKIRKIRDKISRNQNKKIYKRNKK